VPRRGETAVCGRARPCPRGGMAGLPRRRHGPEPGTIHGHALTVRTRGSGGRALAVWATGGPDDRGPRPRTPASQAGGFETNIGPCPARFSMQRPPSAAPDRPVGPLVPGLGAASPRTRSPQGVVCIRPTCSGILRPPRDSAWGRRWIPRPALLDVGTAFGAGGLFESGLRSDSGGPLPCGGRNRLERICSPFEEAVERVTTSRPKAAEAGAGRTGARGAKGGPCAVPYCLRLSGVRREGRSWHGENLPCSGASVPCRQGLRSGLGVGNFAAELAVGLLDLLAEGLFLETPRPAFL